MIKYCIFDLDGTLLNTINTIKFYMNQTLSSRGIKPLSEKECKSFVGSGAKMLMHRACEARNVFDSQLEGKMLCEYMAAYDSNPYHLTEKYISMDELILSLKKDGIKLAVLSNKPDFATRAAVSYFFGDVFDIVRGGRDNSPLKPDPTACFEILREMGGAPSECAYIGDSDVDCITGKNMNAALNISVLWGYRTKAQLETVGAKLFVESVSELENTIKEGISK